MTDANFPTENQVVDLAAVRATKDSTTTTKLTAELFEAAGIKVTDRAPPTADGLVRYQPTKAEILRRRRMSNSDDADRAGDMETSPQTQFEQGRLPSACNPVAAKRRR
jgi:hypothetical protein